MSTHNIASMRHGDTSPLDKQREMELLTLHQIGRIVDSATAPKPMMREVLNVLTCQLNLCRCMISLVQTNGEVQVVGATELSKDELERGRYKNGEGILGQVVRTGLPMVIPNVFDEPTFLNRTGSRQRSSDSVVAFLGVPIKALGGTFGVLSADRDMLTYRGSLQHDVRLLKIVATLISHPLLGAAKRHTYLAEFGWRLGGASCDDVFGGKAANDKSREAVLADGARPPQHGSSEHSVPQERPLT